MAFVVGNAFSFLVFVILVAGNALLIFGLVAFGTGEGLLWYGICMPCSKRLPGVRDAFSEAFGVKNRLLRYGRDIRCAEQPSVVRDASGYSVSAPLSGTEQIHSDWMCHPIFNFKLRNDNRVPLQGETTQKKDKSCDLSFFSSGGWTRTNDLRVMSPTSYQLLYPAMFGNTKVGISFEFTKFFSLLLQILRSAS